MNDNYKPTVAPDAKAALEAAGVLVEEECLTYHDDVSVGPLYRIKLPTEADDE